MECDLLMIKIEKVINKNDLKAFIAFPSSLYPDDPNWIPPLFIERNEHLSAKNPGTDHIIWQAWVAKKAGQIVGRITAQIDTLHRERYGEDTGHFGMYSAAIFLIPICISFDTAEKRRYATYLILNRRFSFAF